jgi:hypothetical protein
MTFPVLAIAAGHTGDLLQELGNDLALGENNMPPLGPVLRHGRRATTATGQSYPACLTPNVFVIKMALQKQAA